MKNRTFIISIGVVVALFILGICVTSCGGKGKIDDNNSLQKSVATAVISPFEAKAEIRLDGMTVNADFNRTESGCMTIAMLEPKALEGMCVQYDGIDIKLSYKGMAIKLKEDSLIASSIMAILKNSLEKVAKGNGLTFSAEGDMVTVGGESQSGNFLVKIDKKSKTVASITLPELDFECSFTAM